MDSLCMRWRQVEDFFNGCRNECDQKCVIDNHEVEILQTPAVESPHCADSWCNSGRATDLCTPRRIQYQYSQPSGTAHYQSNCETERSNYSTPGRGRPAEDVRRLAAHP
mmetsp:Transcript_35689/g.63100  ORF Transcript_35689/g.63100 Transcript_35689/m.63100 type:complete len:109 (-) Transcript_35689:25-351(-)